MAAATILENDSVLIIMNSPIGGLASYTPSKIQLDNEFKLGVSRTTPLNPPASAPGPPAVTERSEEEEYLRPADESETVMWSSGGTSDMLF